MDDARGVAAWAALLADRSRAAFCLALLDGRAWTVGELARHAGIGVSTASEHADRLVAGGLLVQHRQGRHRYLGLAGPEAAALIEAVAAAAPARPAPVTSMAVAHRQRNLRYARTCYDHLAGTVGVALADGLVTAGLVSRDDGLHLTGDGRARLAAAGIMLEPAGRRPLLRDCLDWTERRPHLAGVLGGAICRHAFTAGWIERIGTGRAVRVTPAGTAGLQRLGTRLAEPAGAGKARTTAGQPVGQVASAAGSGVDPA